MGNDIDMLGDAEFENEIDAMGEDQTKLIKFVARQQFATGKVLVDHGKRIKSLEGKNKKVFAITGGIFSMFGAAIIAVINYFTNK